MSSHTSILSKSGFRIYAQLCPRTPAKKSDPFSAKVKLSHSKNMSDFEYTCSGIGLPISQGNGLERVGPRSSPPLWSNGLPLAFIGPPPLVDLPSWLLPTPWWSMCPPGRPMTAQERQITTRNTSSDTMLNEVVRLCCSAISNRIFTLVLCCFVYSFCR